MYAHTKQNYEEDCGIAVVLTLAKQFKRRTDLLSYYIEQLNISEKNVSLFHLKQLLSKFEIFSDPYEITDFDEILTQNFPIIIRTKEINSFHYLVIHEYKNKTFIISDPANEQLEDTSYNDLKNRFSRYALIINSVDTSHKTDSIKSQKGYLQKVVFKSSTQSQKILLYTLNMLVIAEPLLLTVLINKLNLMKIEFIAVFIILLIIYAITLFAYDSLKLKILNNVIKTLLTKSYISELYNIGSEKKKMIFQNTFGIFSMLVKG